jgi:hypothetical protein
MPPSCSTNRDFRCVRLFNLAGISKFIIDIILLGMSYLGGNTLPSGEANKMMKCRTVDRIQGTFSRIQGTFSRIQGTFSRIQGTFSRIQGKFGCTQGTLLSPRGYSPRPTFCTADAS